MKARFALIVAAFLIADTQKSKADFITIENIESKPIVYVDMGFDIEPYQSGFDFQMFSLHRPDPTNYLLQIDWDRPIAPGESYSTPLVPELTGVKYSFEHFSVSGPYVAMTVSGRLIEDVVPDVSTYTEYNPDIDFGVTFSFHSSPILPATIDFDADTLDPKSKGRSVTVYIELPDEYDVRGIDVSTVILNDAIPALTKPTGVGDHDGDGREDLMVKFERAAVQLILGPGEQTIQVSGSLTDKTPFAGTDTTKVLDGS